MTETETPTTTSTTKTVALLGATGKVGGWVLEACLDKGYNVVALARSKGRFDGFLHEHKDTNLTVVEGDATTVVGVRALLDANAPDVVVSTLGSPSNEILVMKKAAEALVGALQEIESEGDDFRKIPRIVWMTSTGINEATDQAKSYPLFGAPSRWLFGYGAFGWLQFHLLIPYVIGQELWDDMGHSEEVIRSCGSESIASRTVLVRPGNMWPVSEHPAFSEAWRMEGGDASGYAWVGACDPPPGKWITRRAIAAALLELLEDDSKDGAAWSLFQS